MGVIKAYAKLFRTWDGLLGACDNNAGELTGHEPLTTELKAKLAEAREVKVQQEHLTFARQSATQRLLEIVAKGEEVARKLRHLVVLRLGSRDERLGQFGLSPIRRRPRKAKPAETPPAAAGNAQTPKPDGSAPAQPPAGMEPAA
ncbi:MAG TPA: hypothetical protein VGG03_19885 [Thermoanaerobaculia bacterium]|jgi:hypothetical protein